MITEIKNTFKSFWFYAFLLVSALVITVFNLEVYGVILFVLIISLILVLSDDIMDTTCPFLILCAFVSICYNSFDTFIKLAPLAIIPCGALIYHYIKYKGIFKVGYSMNGIAAVALAVTLGGFGRITSGEYFSGSSLFYTLGLGVGMIALYLMFKSQIAKDGADAKVQKERFALFMYLMGMVACAVVLCVYLRNFEEFWKEKDFLIFHSRNNYATYLMLAMPFPCYFALKNRAHLLSLALIFGCILLTNSRGGLIFGAIEILICIVYIFVYDKAHRKFYGIVSALLVVGLIAFAAPIFSMYAQRLVNGELITNTESRWRLLLRSIEDFKSYPIFGVGLGYNGNVDIYNPVKGAMNWYHMMIPQIVGSMGLVGIAAYGYQAFGRFKIWLRSKNSLNTALFLSYIGLLLMSQINPGEFCPLPYEFLAVMIFALLEIDYEKTRS